MKIQRRFAPTGGLFRPESVASFARIRKEEETKQHKRTLTNRVSAKADILFICSHIYPQSH